MPEHSEKTDAQIVAEAFAHGSTQAAYGVEMMRRLKGAIEKQTTGAEEQTMWMLRLTWAIAFLTLTQIVVGAIQMLIGLKVIGR